MRKGGREGGNVGFTCDRKVFHREGILSTVSRLYRETLDLPYGR